jgi:hypothetical protein
MAVFFDVYIFNQNIDDATTQFMNFIIFNLTQIKSQKC